MGENHDNNAIIDLMFEELSEAEQALITKAQEQLNEKCLLPFEKTRDGKIFQKSLLPRVLMPGERDPDVDLQSNYMSDMVHYTVNQAIGSHNKIFLNTLQGVMSDVIHKGPHKPVGPMLVFVNANREIASARIRL
jgi:hypothetical protein